MLIQLAGKQIQSLTAAGVTPWVPVVVRDHNASRDVRDFPLVPSVCFFHLYTLLMLWMSLIFFLLPTNQKLSLLPHLFEGGSWVQEDHHIVTFSTLCNCRGDISGKQVSLIFKKEGIVDVRP